MLAPFNIKIMDVDDYIKRFELQEVTSHFIKEPSSNEFHDKGLFSERIFGQIASEERFYKFGYISLHTNILHPQVYINIIRLKSLYGDILSGKAQVKFDTVLKDFTASSVMDESSNTGYSFFLNNLLKIKFEKNQSLFRNDKIDLIEKNAKRIFINKIPVIPAALRDFDITERAQGSINKAYTAVLRYALGIPKEDAENSIYDGIRFALQKKVNEIYEYLFNLIGSDAGFFQEKYAKRGIALGVRNVLSAADTSAADPGSPPSIRSNETLIPLFQAMKQLQPLIIFNMKKLFLDAIFSADSSQASLIDPKTYDLAYETVTELEKNKLLSSDGLINLINTYRNEDVRKNPVVVYNSDGKMFYTHLVYEDGDNIYNLRNKEEFKHFYEENMGKKLDETKLRPLTYMELFYMTTYYASKGKSVVTTRYPVIEPGSTYPSKMHVMSTHPARIVTFRVAFNQDIEDILPEYPILSQESIGSMTPHPLNLAGMDADFDGNCVTGKSRVVIRYTPTWLDEILRSSFHMTNQNKMEVVHNICLNTFKYTKNFNYATINIEDFPQPGNYTYDKNGAFVYYIPTGCFVLSYDHTNCVETFEPITLLTVEADCNCVECYINQEKSIEVSSNESIAVLDRKSGLLKKVKPIDALNDYVPVIKRSEMTKEYTEPFADIIPVSEAEAEFLQQILDRPVIDNSVFRSTVIDIVDQLNKFPSLQKRILNKDICWLRMTCVRTIGSHIVYDFLVDTTKVFVVNDGVVVYDTGSSIAVLSEEANKEIDDYLDSPRSLLSTSGKFVSGLSTDLSKLTLYNMTIDKHK